MRKPSIKPDQYTNNSPTWLIGNNDDFRIIRIKAAKNIIAGMMAWREMPGQLDAGGNPITEKYIAMYERAIQILRDEGETYP